MSLSSRNPNLPWSSLKNKPFVTVTPNGPDDGGDYGPNTQVGGVPTTTCGIQEAINSLRYTGVSTGGGLVRIKGQLTLPATTTGITLYPGIGLEGQGPLAAFQNGTSIINVPTGVTVPAITVEVDPNITTLTTFPYIQNLAISGAAGSSQTGQHGIYVNGSTTVVADFFMSHVLIFQMGGSGLVINNQGKQYFYDCYMEDNAISGVVAQTATVTKISRCYIYGNGQYGVSFSDSVAGTGWREVDNCEIWHNGYDGLNAGGASGGTTDTMLQVVNNRFLDNGTISGSYNNIQLQYQPNFYIGGNSFLDDRGTKLTGYHIYVNDSRSAGVIQGNNFIGSALSGYFQWNISAAANIIVKDNIGYNPVGLMASPWEAGETLVGIQASTFGSANPTASTTYTVAGTDILLTSTGGTAVSITIKDVNGNTVSSGMTTIATTAPYYLPRGWTINFGAFTGTVTTKVYCI